MIFIRFAHNRPLMEQEKLLHKLRDGDLKAYALVFDKHYAWLCNYVFKLSHDRALSEDIVQDVFLKIWEQKKTINISSSLKNYLFKSCHNQFLMHVRREKVHRDMLDNIRWDLLFDRYTDESEYNSKREKLFELLEKLPPRCREIFVKNKLENRKYREIATEMQISIKTVESQMSKALHFLKQHATTFLL